MNSYIYFMQLSINVLCTSTHEYLFSQYLHLLISSVALIWVFTDTDQQALPDIFSQSDYIIKKRNTWSGKSLEQNLRAMLWLNIKGCLWFKKPHRMQNGFKSGAAPLYHSDGDDVCFGMFMNRKLDWESSLASTHRVCTSIEYL